MEVEPMSDQHPSIKDAHFNDEDTSVTQSSQSLFTAKIIYFLYLASLVIGITGLVGLIMAYINKEPQSGEVACNHYRYQIRTFWIGMLYGLVSLVLMLVVVGFVLVLFLYIWMIVRCVKGLKAAERGEPIENVTSWLF